MKDNVWIISLLVGLIVVLVIGGVSLLVKVNDLSKEYKQESAENISLEKTIEDLNDEKTELEEKRDQLNAQNIQLSKTVDKLKKENDQLLLEVKQLKERIASFEEKDEPVGEMTPGQEPEKE